MQNDKTDTVKVSALSRLLDGAKAVARGFGLSSRVLNNFAEEAFQDAAKGDERTAEEFQRFLQMNRRNRRAYASMARHSGKPPASCLTKRMTLGRMRVYQDWSSSLPIELRRQAARVWGKCS